jgi:hypothetical protein
MCVTVAVTLNPDPWFEVKQFHLDFIAALAGFGGNRQPTPGIADSSREGRAWIMIDPNQRKSIKQAMGKPAEASCSKAHLPSRSRRP